MADDGTGATGTTGDHVDVEQLRAKVRAEVESEAHAAFAAKLKEITGAESLDALAQQRRDTEAAKLAEQGEYQKLAEQAQAKAADAEARLGRVVAGSAIVSEAAKAGAVDPQIIAQLLGAHAQVGTDGAVTIGGKPVAEAVGAYLKDHAYLASPSGNTGSGAPASGGGKSEPPKRADFASDIDYHKAAAKHAARHEG